MSDKISITLPNNWQPRHYQLPAWKYLEANGKRLYLNYARRLGKDDLSLHWTACAAMQRTGNYWHMLPQYSQARKAIWEAVNPLTGKRRIDEAFPDAICEAKRSQDMFIRFINGSTWQLVGSDNFDSLVGSPPVGLVFSEYALADPRAWAYLRPILAANDGWAIFATTFRGKNHAYQLAQHADGDSDWCYSKVTAPESGMFTAEQLEKERIEMIAEFGEDEGDALFRQEYLCDPSGSLSGSYFGTLMNTMEDEGRVGPAPYDPSLPVSTGWDIGVGDSMCIVFVQRVGLQIRIIDYYETSGEGVQTAARVLKEKQYVYDQHIMPHDISVREWGSDAKTRYQTALELGIKPIHLVKRTNKAVDERIHAIRTALPQIWIDKKKCAVLIEHLKNYRKKWNEILKCWENKPLHDESSHGVDSLGTYLTGVRETKAVKPVTATYQNLMRGGFGI